MKSSNFKKLLILLIGMSAIVNIAKAAQLGNYLPKRILNASDPNSTGMIFYPTYDVMYDFDTSIPTTGVTVENGTIAVSNLYYMTKVNSLKWNTVIGSTLNFNAPMTFGTSYPNSAVPMISVGFFQEQLPVDGKNRSFSVEFIDVNGKSAGILNIYLRKIGWNILCTVPTISKGTTIKTVRIKQTGGLGGDVYVDNFMFYLNQSPDNWPQTAQILDSVSTLDRISYYPTTVLTDNEKLSFKTISDKVMPPLTPVTSKSASTMASYKLIYDSLKISTIGNFANGMNPLPYHRALPGQSRDLGSYAIYKFNEKLCTNMMNMGKDYNAVQDITQKALLKKYICDIVRLCLTYGGMPDTYYNGRGFADGVYYARDALQEAGLLDRMMEQLKMMGDLGTILYSEHRFDNIPDMMWWQGTYQKAAPLAAFYWRMNADDLNTQHKAVMLAIISGADNSEKARDLYRLSDWLSNLSLRYGPGTQDCLKPDGSWFHHWGNRFDNYGWSGAWSGATDYLYWFSQTPFKVSMEAHETMLHMARVRFKLLQKDSYVGPADYMQKLISSGLLNLARSGTSDGSKKIEPEMASYWMSFPNDASFAANPNDYAAYVKAGIKPAETPQMNHTLSYAGRNIHRRSDWLVYTRMVSKDFYQTQYERNGTLFYTISGIDLLETGKRNSQQLVYGQSMGGGAAVDASGAYIFASGYNLSRAPGVTSVDVDYLKLRQLYYQDGSSTFVGGVSMKSGNGLFGGAFDATLNSAYASTAASSLKFQKSFFYFDNQVVCLASGIASTDPGSVQTGLFQETMNANNDSIYLSNGSVLKDTLINQNFVSDNINWMINNTGTIGIYLTKGQNVKLFKGSQTFGPQTGKVVSAWFEHGKVPTDAGYEYVMCIRPTVDSMKNIANGMKSSIPPFKILQRDKKAHIVYCERNKTTSYVVYDSSTTLPEGIVSKVSSPCTFITEMKQDGTLALGLADPDLHNAETTTNPFRFSMPLELTLTLKGQWKLKDKVITSGVDAPIIKTSINLDGTTSVTVTCKDGLTTECLLEKNVTAVNNINQNQNEPLIKIYPNEILITFTSDGWKNAKGQIVSIDGRILRNFTTKEAITKISTNNLSHGGYLLRLSSDNCLISKRIIK
ncbi:MAG: polysaccharide lyase family 8 super-sandwich domain-containing protein [Paludibacter sp.]